MPIPRKTKSTTTKTTTTTVAQPANSRPKKNKSTPRQVVIQKLRGLAHVYRPLYQSGEDARCLIAAWKNPFSIEAEGCRILDGFCFPTGTRMFRTISTITPSTAGTINLTALPNPFAALVQNNNCAVSTGMTPYPCNQVWCVTTPNSMSLSTYRIVSAGIRIKNLQNMQQITGKVIVVPFPCVKTNALTTDALNTLDSANCVLYSNTHTIGVNPNALGTANIVLPGAIEVAASNLITSNLDCIMRPSSKGTMYDFRGVNVSVKIEGTNNTAGEDFVMATPANVIVAPNVNNTTVDTDAASAGFIGYAIIGTGFPTSPLVPCIEIEHIFHVEGVEAITSGVAAGIHTNRVTHSPPNILDSVFSTLRSEEFVHMMANGAITAANAYMGTGPNINYLRGRNYLLGG